MRVCVCMYMSLCCWEEALSQSEVDAALSTMKPCGKAVLVPLSLALWLVKADIDINNFITSLNHLHTTMEEYVGCDQRTEKLWEDIMVRDKMFNDLNERLLGKMDQLARIRDREEVQTGETRGKWPYI